MKRKWRESTYGRTLAGPGLRSRSAARFYFFLPRMLLFASRVLARLFDSSDGSGLSYPTSAISSRGRMSDQLNGAEDEPSLSLAEGNLDSDAYRAVGWQWRNFELQFTDGNLKKCNSCLKEKCRVKILHFLVVIQV